MDSKEIRDIIKDSMKLDYACDAITAREMAEELLKLYTFVNRVASTKLGNLYYGEAQQLQSQSKQGCNCKLDVKVCSDCNDMTCDGKPIKED